MSKLVIYTATIGRQDEIQAPMVVTAGADYICFTDLPETVPPPWQTRPAVWASISPDPMRAARHYKVLAHKHFPDLGPSDLSIWQDATHAGSRDYGTLDLGGHDLAALSHFSRDCLYDEADQVALHGLDDQGVILAQVKRYLHDGYPPHRGLHDSSFLVRRHTSAVEDFNNQWWQAIAAGSRRDQLSFDYVLWKTGLKCLTLAGVSRRPGADGPVNTLFTFQPRGQRLRPVTPWL